MPVVEDLNNNSNNNNNSKTNKNTVIKGRTNLEKMQLIKTIYYDVTLLLLLAVLVIVVSVTLVSTDSGLMDEAEYNRLLNSFAAEKERLFVDDDSRDEFQVKTVKAMKQKTSGEDGEDDLLLTDQAMLYSDTEKILAKSGYNIASTVEEYANKVTMSDNLTRLMTEEGMLKRWLFSRYGLHITDRPVLRHNDTVSIKLKFELLRFLHIDDLRGSMAVLAIVVLTWTNPFLAWRGNNVTEARISRLALKSGEVWTPLILHLNNVKELNVVDKYGRGRGNMVMEVFDDGTQLWPPTGIYESSCDLNFTYFPLDKQTCTFVFESWLANQFVNISNARAVIHDERTFISKSQIWEFRSLSASTTTITYGGSPYSQAWVVISMRRRHAYYTWNILVPCGCLSLLQLSTFALPPETPERASFSVTVLVAFGILQTIIKAEIPTTSDTVLLIIYVVGQLSVGTLATFYIVISVGLGSYSFPQFPMPKKRKKQKQQQSPNRLHNKLDNNVEMDRLPEVTKDLLATTTTTACLKRRHNEPDQTGDQSSSDDNNGNSDETNVGPTTGYRSYAKRLLDKVFFQRPILEIRTIRIMDAIAFTLLAVLTFVGHITTYALLHSAASNDDD